MKYLLLAATATALFFAVYWLLIRNEKRHTMVRFYLLGSLLISLLLPTIHLRVTIPQHYVAQSEAVVTATPINQNTPNIQHTPSIQSNLTTPTHLSATQLLSWLWLAGCIAMLTLTAVRMLKLWRRMCALPYCEEEDMRLTLLDDDTPAFSFGRHIVVGTKGFSDAEVQQLIGHERVHVHQGHTADLLLCELIKAVLWFDPFVYLYARELKRVHEYIADNEMMSVEYAELFYHQVSGQCYSTLVHTFDYTMIHQRITMMARHRTLLGWLKPFAALPIVAGVLLAACQPKTSPIVGEWEFVGINREYIYDDGQTNFHINEDEPDNAHQLSHLNFRSNGTATIMAWDISSMDSTFTCDHEHQFKYTPYNIEWQIVADTLLMSNDKGDREAVRIVSLNDETLIFVSSSIFRLHDSDNADYGRIRETYTYRRKK